MKIFSLFQNENEYNEKIKEIYLKNNQSNSSVFLEEKIIIKRKLKRKHKII